MLAVLPFRRATSYEYSGTCSTFGRSQKDPYTTDLFAIFTKRFPVYAPLAHTLIKGLLGFVSPSRKTEKPGALELGAAAIDSETTHIHGKVPAHPLTIDILLHGVKLHSSERTSAEPRSSEPHTSKPQNSEAPISTPIMLGTHQPMPNTECHTKPQHVARGICQRTWRTCPVTLTFPLGVSYNSATFQPFSTIFGGQLLRVCNGSIYN